ncbi:MAG: protein-L-isoaspartate O-methyltransferase [Brachymonas sp.]
MSVTLAQTPDSNTKAAAIADIEHARWLALEQQIRPWIPAIAPELADAFLATPREDFAPAALRGVALSDTDLPTAGGQFMLSPKVQLRLIHQLQLKPSDRVLQIGAGTGYMTALMAKLAAHVTAYECQAELANTARLNLLQAGIGNAQIIAADITESQTTGSFDAIVFCGGVAQLPSNWSSRLNEGGRLLALVGQDPMMRATLLTRHSETHNSQSQPWDSLAPYLRGFAATPAFAL